TKPLVAAERLHDCFVGALDDKGVVEFRIPHLDVLHSEKGAQIAEYGGSVNRKTETAWIGKRGAHARISNRYRRSAGHHHYRVLVERDGPIPGTSLKTVASPDVTRDNFSADLRSQRRPDFVATWAK